MKEEFRICLELKDGSGIWLNREAYESYKRGEWDPNAPLTPEQKAENEFKAKLITGSLLKVKLANYPERAKQEMAEHPDLMEAYQTYLQYKREHPESDL